MGINLPANSTWNNPMYFSNLARGIPEWSLVNGASSIAQNRGSITSTTDPNAIFMAYLRDGWNVAGDDMPAGTYTIKFTGNGSIALGQFADFSTPDFLGWTASSGSEVIATCNVTSGNGFYVFFRGSSLTNIEVIRPLTGAYTDAPDVNGSQWAQYNAGNEWNPDFIRWMKSLNSPSFRSMDLNRVNLSILDDVTDMPSMSDVSWRYMPYEAIMDLANRLGQDPWINLPARANASMQQAVAATFSLLNPGRKARVELGNEVWNWAVAYADGTSWWDRATFTKRTATVTGCVDLDIFISASTVDIANDQIVAPHSFVNGDKIVCRVDVLGHGIGGLSDDTQYFVVGVVPGVSFKLSLTSGGAAINLTSVGYSKAHFRAYTNAKFYVAAGHGLSNGSAIHCWQDKSDTNAYWNLCRGLPSTVVVTAGDPNYFTIPNKIIVGGHNHLIYTNDAEAGKVVDYSIHHTAATEAMYDTMAAVADPAKFEVVLAGQSGYMGGGSVYDKVARISNPAKIGAVAIAPYIHPLIFSGKIVVSGGAATISGITAFAARTLKYAIYPAATPPARSDVINGGVGSIATGSTTAFNSSSYSAMTPIVGANPVTGLTSGVTYRCYFYEQFTGAGGFGGDDSYRVTYVDFTVTADATFYAYSTLQDYCDGWLIEAHTNYYTALANLKAAAAAKSPTLKVVTYEGGAEWSNQGTVPAEVTAKAREYELTADFAATFRRFFTEVASVGGASEFQYYLGITNTSMGLSTSANNETTGRFTNYKSYNTTQGRVLRYADIPKINTPLPNIMGIVAADPASGAGYPYTLATLTDISGNTSIDSGEIKYKIVGDSAARFGFAGNLLQMVNGEGLNWTTGDSTTLSLMTYTDNGPYTITKYPVLMGNTSAFIDPVALPHNAANGATMAKPYVGYDQLFRLSEGTSGYATYQYTGATPNQVIKAGKLLTVDCYYYREDSSTAQRVAMVPTVLTGGDTATGGTVVHTLKGYPFNSEFGNFDHVTALTHRTMQFQNRMVTASACTGAGTTLTVGGTLVNLDSYTIQLGMGIAGTGVEDDTIITALGTGTGGAGTYTTNKDVSSASGLLIFAHPLGMAPASATGCSISGGTTLTIGTLTGKTFVGMHVTGVGIPAQTHIAMKNVDGTYTLSKACTNGAVAGTVSFGLTHLQPRLQFNAATAAGRSQIMTAIKQIIALDAMVDVIGTNVSLAFGSPVPGFTRVQFGLTNAYGSQWQELTTLTTNHIVDLTSADGLVAATTYHFRVGYSTNGADWVYSGDVTFTTGT